IGKFMTGKIASVRPFVSDNFELMIGSSTPKDMEYMLQMMYAYFTDVNYDEEAFNTYVQKQSGFTANMLSQPAYYFLQEFYSFLNKDNPRFVAVIPDEKIWKSIDYKLSYNVFNERFSNAADFEFIFVGNIDDKRIEE